MEGRRGRVKLAISRRIEPGESNFQSTLNRDLTKEKADRMDSPRDRVHENLALPSIISYDRPWLSS